MKKMLLSLPIFAGIVLLMIGADFRSPREKAVVELKKHCAGYTVLEAGLGVDCNGDTVKLIKKYGYYELASHYEKSDLAVSAN
jgi:hypothetical protein